MRVGPHGLLQPIADAFKLLLKEDIIPANADKAIFWFAPCVSTITALTAFAVLPFARNIFVADVNVGLLVISATSAVGILGIILGGWSSNSHYSAAGRAARRGATGELRSGAGVRAGFRRDGGGHAQPARHRQGPTRPRRVVRLRQLLLHDCSVRGVPHRGHGRNQPRAVRPAGSRIGAGGRLPHRVQRFPLCALFPRRVRQHLRGGVGGRDAVLGRLAAALPQRGLAGCAAQRGVSGGAVRRLRRPDAAAGEASEGADSAGGAGSHRPDAGADRRAFRRFRW